MASTGGNFPFAFRGVRRRVGAFDFIAVHGGYVRVSERWVGMNGSADQSDPLGAEGILALRPVSERQVLLPFLHRRALELNPLPTRRLSAVRGHH